MTNKTLASACCTLLLGLLILVPIASWVMLALGMSVHNILCAEGYRWVWMHADECLAPAYLVPVIALVIAWGCVQCSGVLNVLFSRYRTVNERLGLTSFLVVFLLLFLWFLVPVFRVDSAMRSVTGLLFPSPWFSCAPYLLSGIMFLASFSFMLFTSKERFPLLIGRLLSSGISRYALWLINLSLLNFLIEIIKYVFHAE